MDRETGSTAAGGRSANWTAELGVNPTSATGRPIWCRGPCPLPWQRPQGPMHAVVALRGRHAAGPSPPEPTTPVFPTARGKPMSSDAFQRLVARHIKSAGKTCPSLRRKKVSPHTLRHTTAMDLLHRGVDITVIALWLGHESIHGNGTSCLRCVR